QEKHLTGMGRFVAHLVQALARLAPLGLLTTAAGRYIPVRDVDLAESDGDVEKWARQLLRLPWQALERGATQAGVAISPALRPAARCFRREVGILYDFTTLLLPWTHGEESRHHFGAFFSRTAPLCDKLVAIS